MEKNRKSKAKAMGVKSTFNINGSTVVTTFGKGNDAIVEKTIENGIVKTNTENPSIDLNVIKPDNKEFEVIKGRVSFPDEELPVLYMPKTEDVKINTGDKYVSYKEELEKRFFGRTFNDSIHIQLIYNILKINKILASHSNNATFVVNNLFSTVSGEPGRDIFESISTANTYSFVRNIEVQNLNPKAVESIKTFRETFDKIFDVRNNYSKEKPRRENARLSYYGNAYYKRNGKLRDDEDIFNSYALLGSIRNTVTDSLPSKLFSNILFNLDSNKVDKSFKDTLDRAIEDIDYVNNGFVKNNKVNYYILFSAYNCFSNNELRKQITRLFYEFAVTKAYKNMGFKIKQIRENIIKTAHPELADKKYDSCRSKLYQLLDFVIYYHYLDKDSEVQAIVDLLRASRSNEDKEKIYADEAKRVYGSIKEAFRRVTDLTNPVNIGRIDKNKVHVSEADIAAEKVTGYDYFSKLVYMLTLFLDGKQINDLLTTLIHSFENINAFKHTLSEIGETDPFVFPYEFFNNQKTVRIAKELRFINSVARMKISDPGYKKAQYTDAMIILGTQMSSKEISEEADAFLSKDTDNNLRNFLANNVIESRRYKYLVRYIRPSMAKAVASNPNIVRFVLNDIPEAQIKRYYDSVYMKHIVDRHKKDKYGNPLQRNIPPEPVSADEMRSKLSDVILRVKYDDFKDVRQKVRRGTEDELDKERKKAVIRLYLTVIYIFVKNMVNVNSRYVIAFHCLERDSGIFGYDMREKQYDSDGKPIYNKNYSFLTVVYINTANELYNAELEKPFKQRNKVKRPINQRFCRILENNLVFRAPSYSFTDRYSENPALRSEKRKMIENHMSGDNNDLAQKMQGYFRNNVAHLNVLRTFDSEITSVDGKTSTIISCLGRFNSYFEAYHFLMQLQLTVNASGFIAEKAEVKELRETLLKTGCYSKNTVKTLCAPFGYNLIRYKNLTINELFDKNAVNETDVKA